MDGRCHVPLICKKERQQVEDERDLLGRWFRSAYRNTLQSSPRDASTQPVDNVHSQSQITEKESRVGEVENSRKSEIV